MSNQISLENGASVSTQGDDAAAIFAGGAGNKVTLRNSASVITTGDSSIGIIAGGGNNLVTLTDDARVTTLGNAAAAIAAGGPSFNSIILNDRAALTTQGSQAHGVSFGDDAGGNRESLRAPFDIEPTVVLSLNGNSSIATSGWDSVGVSFGEAAINNIIRLKDSTSLTSTGARGSGIAFGDSASSNFVSLGGTSLIRTTNGGTDGIFRYVDSRGVHYLPNRAKAIAFGEGATDNGVTLSGSAKISSAGDFVEGIHFDHEASNNMVNLSGIASVETNGINGDGVEFLGSFIFMIDGNKISFGNIGPKNNAVVLEGSAALRMTGGFASGIAFGSDASGNSVTLTDNSSIETSGDSAPGIEFEYQGTSNTVTLAPGTSITTTGTNSPAIKDGDGSLTVVSAGLLSSASGVAVDLGDGDDSLTLQDGARVVGQVDGGGGTDTLILEGSTGFLDINHINFENLTVQAALNGAWDVTADIALPGTANVDQGRLSVNAVLTAPTVAVAAGAILGGSGTINSAVTIGGILAPGNSVGTLNVNGAVAFGAGASMDVEVDRTGMDLLAVSGAPGTITIDPATTVNVIHLDRAEGHAGNIVTATGGITGSFGTLSTAASPANSIAATLVQTANAIRLVTAAPSVFSSQVWAGSEEGFAFQDMLSDEAGASRTRTDRRGWTAAVYRDTERSRSRTIQPFDQNLHGTALGTDLYREGPVRIGAAVGYTGSEVELGSATGEGDFDSIHAGLYGSYHRGSYFLDGTVTGGYQDGDGERVVIVDGATLKAKADSGGYLVGTSVRTGWTLPLGGGWSARPSVGFSYMHRHQDRYSERGAGDAGVSLDSENSDAARMNWQVQVARASTVNLGGKSIALRPSARLGLMREWALDDRNIEGRFQADGSAFSLHMDGRDETLATFGVGIDATFDGWTLFASYDGAASQITDRNTVTAGIRKAW